MVRNGLYPLCTMIRLPACGPENVALFNFIERGSQWNCQRGDPRVSRLGSPVGAPGTPGIRRPMGDVGWPGLFAVPLGLNSVAHIPHLLSGKEPTPGTLVCMAGCI